jgi:tetratricopeptide (TPR) repeat protein
MIKPLEPPDSLHLQFAQGWCELHAFTEADAELDNIAATLRAHPQVLKLRWRIYANLKNWTGALDIANAIVKVMPDCPNGWGCLASSLTRLNRHQEAYETLSEAATLFPRDDITMYDLACVCCALGRIKEARTWLARSIDIGGKDVKVRALDDPDLEPLWKHGGSA